MKYWLCDWIGWVLWQLSKVKLYPKPKMSRGICGRFTYGYGRLSRNGYWRFSAYYEGEIF